MISPLTLNLPHGVLAIEPIAPLAELEAEATPAELQSVEKFSAPARRAERLAWRRTLRRLAGKECEISYSEQGAPQLKNCTYQHISVSHCADCVAVMLSDQPCGVDIERTERNYERIAKRYATEQERSLSVEETSLAAIWCAKEALYKMQGREGVDFLRDMEILSLDMQGGEMSARLGDNQIVQLAIIQPDSQHILVYTK